MMPTTALGVLIALQPLALLKKHIQVASAPALQAAFQLTIALYVVKQC